MHGKVSRRTLLKASAALAAASVAPRVSVAAAPPASAVTPELIAAAKKEGRVVWYTSVDLPLAELVQEEAGRLRKRGTVISFHGEELACTVRAPGRLVVAALRLILERAAARQSARIDRACRPRSRST